MATHVAIYGLLAIGMLLVILNGGIDLSVGSTLALCGRGRRLADAGRDARTPSASSSIRRSGSVVVLTCALGAFVGAVNGVLIAYLKVPAFVATLGMHLRGARRRAADDQRPHLQQPRRPAELGNTGFDWLGFNRLGGVPIGVLVLAVDRDHLRPHARPAPPSAAGSTPPAATSARPSSPASRSSASRSPSTCSRASAPPSPASSCPRS